MSGHGELSAAISAAAPAVVPYLTAGYPDLSEFIAHLDGLSAVSPAIEVGIPFSDPMADGLTIQGSSRQALAGGATLKSILEVMGRRSSSIPLVVMSYLNPLWAFGLDDLMPRLADVGVAALVIPDLPFEESGPIAEAAASHSVGLVQLVTPLTDDARLEMLCARSQGFVYAVTMTGTTGSSQIDTAGIGAYLKRAKEASSVPVLAGFGVRTSEQVTELGAYCDGVIVGSALVETISSGGDPVAFVEGLHQ